MMEKYMFLPFFDLILKIMIFVWLSILFIATIGLIRSIIKRRKDNG